MEWNKQKIKHQWQDEETWQMFELLCEEENSEENQKILNYARYGILCHHGKLNIELRNIIEKLMRNDKPKIIVATMTLGQG
jgi:replicative superfamily II helicase